MRLKIDLYRRLARVSNRAELDDFRAELVDRFGPPPPVVQHLLELAEMRIAAHRWRITSIHLEDQYVVFRYTLGPADSAVGGPKRRAAAGGRCPKRLSAAGQGSCAAGRDPRPR